MSLSQRLQKQDRQLRPRVVSAARERLASGYYDRHEPELLELAVVPLHNALLAGDEQARRDEFDMTVGDRWE